MKLLRSLVPLLVVSFFGCWFAGCSSTTVQSAGVGVSLLAVTTEDNGTVVFDIQLQNENLVALALANSSYKVSINGAPYGLAVVEKPMALVERTAVNVAAKLSIQDPAALAGLRTALSAGPVSYQLDCRLVSMIGDDRLVLLTKASGTLDAR